MAESERSPQEMVAGVVALLMRRKWTILVPFLVISLSAIAVVGKLPRRYVSEATLVVSQPKISSEFTASEKTSPLDDVQVMKRQILSDVRLADIIREQGLYLTERQRTDRMDVLTARMREDVEIEPVDEVRRGDFRAFRISFVASSPEVARATVQKLVSLFLELNGRDREERVTRTADYLSDEVQAAKQRLDDQERRLKSAMTQSVQEDSQRRAASGTVTELRTRLVNAQASLRGAEDRRFALESTLQANLATLQGEKDVLLRKATAQHPEVLKKDQQMARLQGILSLLRLKNAAAEPTGGDDPSIIQIRTQAASVVNDLANFAREAQQVQTELAGAQERENAGSVHQGEVSEIERDVDLFRKAYSDALLQQQRAQKQVGAEQRQEAQTYRLIDPPTLPVLPISPNLIKFHLGSVAAGLFVGLALALWFDLRQSAVHTESDITAIAQVPLVLSIPLMQSARELNRKRFRNVADWMGAAMVFLIVAAAEIYVLRKG